MRLTILGSGTAVPHPERTSAAHYLETSGGSIVLDFGASAPYRMAEEKLDWVNLDAIWVSHFHLDHIGGVGPFLFGTRHAPAMKDRKKTLTIHGPRGLRLRLEAFNELGGGKLFDQPFPLFINEIEPRGQFEVMPGIMATTIPTPHTEESTGIRIDDGHKSIVYTSDTGYSSEWARFASKVDLLLMECSFFRSKPVSSHLELSEAMRIAGECDARTVALVHLYPEWDGIDLSTEAQHLWNGKTLEGKDGLVINL